MTLRALSTPRPVQVTSDDRGSPREVVLDGRRRRVEAVRDDWLVQDRWWTDRVVDRHYFELVLEPGRLVLAFRDAVGGGWFVQ